MSSTFSVIDDGKLSAREAMDRDFKAIAGLSLLKNPVIRFWEWQQPSITYGYFTPVEKLLKAGAEDYFDIAKRPTGGGMLFHMGDLSFSIAVPSNCSLYSDNVDKNYEMVNGILLEALAPFLANCKKHKELFEGEALKNYCQANLTRFDLGYCGFKVGGGAQRKTKDGFLHQGTIFLQEPDWAMLEKAVYGGCEALGVMQRTVAWLGIDIKRVQEAMSLSLIRCFKSIF